MTLNPAFHGENHGNLLTDINWNKLAQLLRILPCTVTVEAERTRDQWENQEMDQYEEIRQKIMEMVIAAKDQRQRPHSLVKTVSDNSGVPIFKVKKVLEKLLKERKLVFTYRDPCSFVEVPINDICRESHPMKVVVDEEGSPWICDHDVDPSKDLARQGCWQVREEDSTRKP
jgi:hypothetical protein